MESMVSGLVGEVCAPTNVATRKHKDTQQKERKILRITKRPREESMKTGLTAERKSVHLESLAPHGRTGGTKWRAWTSSPVGRGSAFRFFPLPNPRKFTFPRVLE